MASRFLRLIRAFLTLVFINGQFFSEMILLHDFHRLLCGLLGIHHLVFWLYSSHNLVAQNIQRNFTITELSEIPGADPRQHPPELLGNALRQIVIAD